MASKFTTPSNDMNKTSTTTKTTATTKLNKNSSNHIISSNKSKSQSHSQAINLTNQRNLIKKRNLNKTNITDELYKCEKNVTDTCDKLSSEVNVDKPNLRVNVINKYDQQSNTLSTSQLRFDQPRLSQPNQHNTINKQQVRANKSENFSQRFNKKIIGTKDKVNSSASKNYTDTNVEQNVNSRDIVSRSSNNQFSSNNDTGSTDESKNCVKFIVSLVRDLAKNIDREQLDELFKEIGSVIDEIQTEQSCSKANRVTSKNSSCETRISRKSIEKRHAQGGDSLKSIHDSFNETDAKKTSKSIKSVNSCKNELNKNSASDCSKTNKIVNLKSIENRTKKIEIKNDSVKDKQKEKESSLVTKNKSNSIVISGSSSCDECNEIVNKTDPTYSNRLPERFVRITSSHAKYISPHRKRSLVDRMNRAQEAREKFLEYRANKFRDILKKIEEMRAWKEEDTLNLKASVQKKLQKAAEKRKEQLDKIIRKAHDEDSKVNEIQFINNLEAQNRRHDLNSRKRDFEARLQDIQDERQRKFEEKQAKEAAAEERRKHIESERKAKLIEIEQRRNLRNQKVELQQQVKERKRLEKNRNRDQRIFAIKEAYNVGVQSLKRRINQKLESSERRHEINLRIIRQKAFELSIKRYNSYINEINMIETNYPVSSAIITSNNRSKTSKVESANLNETKRLQLKPFTTKKFCNLCKEIIGSESALFSHLRSETHYNSINEHYDDSTNELVEIHNLRHIVETNEQVEPSTNDKNSISDGDQHSSRGSSLVNYYHNTSYLSNENCGILMNESDRKSLLAIERKCRKLRQNLISAGKGFNRDWFVNKIRLRLAQLSIEQRLAKGQTTNTDVNSLANMIDLSANNSICQDNRQFYLKINRICRELVNVSTDQRISGGGLLPANIIHNVDKLLADLTKQLNSRKVPKLNEQILNMNLDRTATIKIDDDDPTKQQQSDIVLADKLSMATKMIEFHAIDTIYLYDIISSLVLILRRIVPNVTLNSKLSNPVVSHYRTLLDPISLNSYYCHHSPILPPRIYIRLLNLLQNLCSNHGDLCYIIFHSNNIIHLSDILSYRLGFIIGNDSPTASSISGSSSAATLSAQPSSTDTGNSNNSKKNKARLASKLLKDVAKPDSNENFDTDRVELDECDLNGGQSNKKKLQQQQKEKMTSDECVDVDGEREADFRDEIALDDCKMTETYRRSEEIVDDMTAALCKLLATVTETILSRPLVLLGQVDRCVFIKRSDDFISYMVSVGIVDTESVIMSHIHQRQSTADYCGLSAAVQPSEPPNPPAAPPSPPAGEGQSGAAANGKIINFTASCVQFVTSLLKLVIAKPTWQLSLSLIQNLTEL